MIELLAPAGSTESVTAAVQNGADAIYFGYGNYNARRNAKNFSEEEAAAAVSYCHLRGTKVHLTMNTLLTDREMEGAAQLAAHASSIGIDALIVQDLGVMRMLRQSAPDLPIHGSTQMTVHDLDGVKLCADLGVSRVVLSRELSRRDIAYICEHSPIEIEVFGHGAMCMCYSGQCFFSSVIGGRSGNRGLCAQPCRLKYGWAGKANEYPLSLKDMSLATHLKELDDMGVACLKLEGRMKRPEYVAIVTGVYARALKEGRDPTKEELEQLEQIFSRQGFSDGYFMGKKGPDMFGVRPEQDTAPKELYAMARSSYENGENKKNPVKFYALIEKDQPAQIAVQDGEGHVSHAQGPVPEAARNVPLTAQKVEGQLARTGGTPYICEKAIVKVEDGLSLPLSALNDLRRQALEGLSRQRVLLPQRRTLPFHAGVRYENQRQAPVITASVRLAGQVTDELLSLRPEILYVPVDELSDALVERCKRAGVEVAVALPRICTDKELSGLEHRLIQLKKLGVGQALAGTWGMARRGMQLGFLVRGDYGLGTYNSQSIKELKRLGFAAATPSFELKFPQLRDLSKNIPCEFVAYGRLPLMITENCIVHNHTGQHTCEGVNLLTDRKGEKFPVVKAWGCRNEILNSKTLFLADKAGDYARLGLWGARLMFTTESPEECVKVMERYMGMGIYAPKEYTRGLYYRDVE